MSRSADVFKQLAQLRGRLFLPVGDGLGVAPGLGENAGRRRLGGIQVGGYPAGAPPSAALRRRTA